AVACHYLIKTGAKIICIDNGDTASRVSEQLQSLVSGHGVQREIVENPGVYAAAKRIPAAIRAAKKRAGCFIAWVRKKSNTALSFQATHIHRIDHNTSATCLVCELAQQVSRVAKIHSALFDRNRCAADRDLLLGRFKNRES